MKTVFNKKHLLAVFVVLSMPFLLKAVETHIDDIQIRNSAPFSSEELLEVIRSEREALFDPRLIKLDQILLSNFYRKQGFLRVRVLDTLKFSPTREKVTLSYTIKHGPRFYLEEITFSGNRDIDSTRLDNEVMQNIELRVPIDESVLGEVRQRLEDLYYNSGKPFVEIAQDYEFKQDTLVYVRFNIRENQTVIIRDIRYIGLELVQKFIIRRELEIKRGDIYNRKKLDNSQQNIYSTGLFQFVRLELEPDRNNPGQATLIVRVKEKEARWIGLYMGVAHEQQEFYGSKMELTFEGGHRNLYGTGRSASLHITPSLMYESSQNKLINAENEITFKFVEPWIGYTRTPGIFQISYHQFRLPNSADFDLLRASFEVHHKFDKYEVNATLSAKQLDQLDNGDIDLTRVTDFDEGQSRVYGLSLYGKRDTRNNLFNPENGALNDLSISFSQSVGLVDNRSVTNRYLTLISSWQRYQPWRPTIFGRKLDWVLASRLKSGMIYELGGAKNIPISERFYAGGATSVRGYGEQLLGPAAALNEQGQIISAAGGKLLFLANIEARIPLFWLLVGEVFVDAGNVWSEIGDFRPLDIRLTTGLGLAMITPLGPIRVDYGYKLTPRPSDPTPDSFHLGIYFAF